MFKYMAFELLQLELHSNNTCHCSSRHGSCSLFYSQQSLCKHILARGLVKYSLKPFSSAFTIMTHFNYMKGHLWNRTECFCSPTT